MELILSAPGKKTDNSTDNSRSDSIHCFRIPLSLSIQYLASLPHLQVYKSLHQKEFPVSTYSLFKVTKLNSDQEIDIKTLNVFQSCSLTHVWESIIVNSSCPKASLIQEDGSYQMIKLYKLQPVKLHKIKRRSKYLHYNKKCLSEHLHWLFVKILKPTV